MSIHFWRHLLVSGLSIDWTSLDYDDYTQSGCWLGHPFEKYERQLGWLDTQYFWENKIDGNQSPPTSNSLLGSIHPIIHQEELWSSIKIDMELSTSTRSTQKISSNSRMGYFMENPIFVKQLTYINIMIFVPGSLSWLDCNGLMQLMHGRRGPIQKMFINQGLFVQGWQ